MNKFRPSRKYKMSDKNFFFHIVKEQNRNLAKVTKENKKFNTYQNTLIVFLDKYVASKGLEIVRQEHKTFLSLTLSYEWVNMFSICIDSINVSDKAFLSDAYFFSCCGYIFFFINSDVDDSQTDIDCKGFNSLLDKQKDSFQTFDPKDNNCCELCKFLSSDKAVKFDVILSKKSIPKIVLSIVIRSLYTLIQKSDIVEYKSFPISDIAIKTDDFENFRLPSAKESKFQIKSFNKIPNRFSFTN